jgi:predicted RNase H-like HicB family nuclease
MEKARRAVRQYRVTIECADGEYYGRCVEIPGARGDGSTADECVKSTHESATAVAAYMLEKGQPLPLPAREGVRSEQVNVRLSADEKAALAASADRLGFKGLADYIRAVALGFGQGAFPAGSAETSG